MSEKITRGEYWYKLNAEQRRAFMDEKHKEVANLIICKFTQKYPHWADEFEKAFWFVFEYMNYRGLSMDYPAKIELKEALEKEIYGSEDETKQALLVFFGLLDKIKLFISNRDDRERELNSYGDKVKVYDSWTQESIISGFAYEHYECDDGEVSRRFEIWAEDNIFDCGWKCVELLENGMVIVE